MSLSSLTSSTMGRLQNYLDIHTNDYQDTMDKLSTGNKYTNTKDNPVAVCDSAKLAVKINTNNTANSNVELGNDVLTLAEESQGTIISSLTRINDLCVQILNDAYSTDDKNSILEEIKARLDSIDSLANGTAFNDIKLLDGSADSLTLQVGTRSNDTIVVGSALIDATTEGLDINLDDVHSIDDWPTEDIQDYKTKLETATGTLINSSSKLGAYQNRLTFVSDTLTSVNNNLTQKKSVISDADVAEESANLIKYQILQQASVSIFTQANQVSSMALSLIQK